jgi:hypothetical protein
VFPPSPSSGKIARITKFQRSRYWPLLAVILNDLGKTLLAQLDQNVTGGDNRDNSVPHAFRQQPTQLAVRAVLDLRE